MWRFPYHCHKSGGGKPFFVNYNLRFIPGNLKLKLLAFYREMIATKGLIGRSQFIVGQGSH
jgi:hypothetical protein